MNLRTQYYLPNLEVKLTPIIFGQYYGDDCTQTPSLRDSPDINNHVSKVYSTTGFTDTVKSTFDRQPDNTPMG